jgi:hypothetical protein
MECSSRQNSRIFLNTVLFQTEYTLNSNPDFFHSLCRTLLCGETDTQQVSSPSMSQSQIPWLLGCFRPPNQLMSVGNSSKSPRDRDFYHPSPDLLHVAQDKDQFICLMIDCRRRIQTLGSHPCQHTTARSVQHRYRLL